MTRKEQIEAMARRHGDITGDSLDGISFLQGAEWADANPKTPFEAAKTIMGERDILEQKLAIAVEALEKLDNSSWDTQLEAMNACHDALAKIRGER